MSWPQTGEVAIVVRCSWELWQNVGGRNRALHTSESGEHVWGEDWGDTKLSSFLMSSLMYRASQHRRVEGVGWAKSWEWFWSQNGQHHPSFSDPCTSGIIPIMRYYPHHEVLSPSWGHEETCPEFVRSSKHTFQHIHAHTCMHTWIGEGGERERSKEHSMSSLDTFTSHFI